MVRWSWSDLMIKDIIFKSILVFQEAGVTTTDHHSATESFMKHMKKEVWNTTIISLLRIK